MAPISKRVREEAIDELLACADDGIRGFAAFVGDGGARLPASRLAHRAQDSFPTLDDDLLVDDRLEAAALLRDGWSPGEPVRLLKKRGRS